MGVENHIDTLDPLCTPEQLTRWYYYPPPYYDTINHIWKYRHPWLWYDGNKHGGREYLTWRAKIMNQTDVPAPVTIRISGSYDPVSRNGTMRVVYRNDSTGTIHQARAITAITEDSIIYHAPSGDSVHNNVARDYVPDPDGQIFSIPAGDSAVIAQYFALDTAWNVNKCMIVTWLQNDSMTADTVKPIYQGGKKLISELDQFATGEEFPVRADLLSWARPNPCRDGTQFVFILAAGKLYKINIFDIQGRKIREIAGFSKTLDNRVYWDCKNGKDEIVRSGVYFYRISSDPASPVMSGKVIVR